MNDDLISRQAAIDAIEQHKTAVLEGREWDEGIAYGYAAAHRHPVEIVRKLPSAQPEQEPCKDCVSRESLLDKRWDVPFDGKYIQVVDVGDIMKLPPVTPTRKKGK